MQSDTLEEWYAIKLCFKLKEGNKSFVPELPRFVSVWSVFGSYAYERIFYTTNHMGMLHVYRFKK